MMTMTYFLPRERKLRRKISHKDENPKVVSKHFKRRWTDAEYKLFFATFGTDISKKVMPGGSRLRELAKQMGHSRTVAQIRTQLHNYMTGKIKSAIPAEDG